MAGGPVTGASIYAQMAAPFPGGHAMTASADPPGNDSVGIVIPTVLQMAADALNYWTNLTCLYDPYWVADPEKVTLPICMFNVVKITPTYTVETSNKRIILYEQQQHNGKLSVEQLSNQFRENVMRTVIDNSVRMPNCRHCPEVYQTKCNTKKYLSSITLP